MAILPQAITPKISAVRGASARYDALLVVASSTGATDRFAGLPDAASLRALQQRPGTKNSVRHCTLANAARTRAFVVWADDHSSPFEKLAQAGRLVKAAFSDTPRRIAIAVRGFDKTCSEAWREALLTATLAGSAPLPKFSAKPSKNAAPQAILFLDPHQLDVARIVIGARANALARWLTALPPNKLDAVQYRNAIATLARRHGLQFKWYDERQLRRLGAGAFLAVAAGNADRNAGIAQLRYRPKRTRSDNSASRRRPDIALVGKGILFDTGGNNLKPHRSMLDMHIDMAGSAVALATIVALSELRTPLAVDAWLAITENRIGPTAYRPQDVVTAVNGVTIQVIHTDAEGRMALADTLALAARAQPRAMLDYATLTGACVYALTERMSGVFTNRNALGGILSDAGAQSGERVLNFPLDADFDSDLESKVADIMQCTLNGKGDHILAARFLMRFVPDAIPWVHMDLAAAMRSGGLGAISSDITGFGVRYTLQLLGDARFLKAIQT